MKYLILLLTLSLFLNAQELDNLLDTYTHNSDLSEKTKLESGGSVIVFTRQDIETMQARNLKDLLKSNPLVRYKESRFGISEMNNYGGNAFFSSSNVRVFIDNQEFTSVDFGSGFPLASNLSLNAIDHVEIYSQSPSYEFSTEPTYLLIKLYSKLASRDRGGKLEVSLGSRGFNQESLFYADEFEEFSYTTSISRLEDKKHIYSSHDIPIDRDGKNISFFGTLYTDNHKLQLMAGKSDPGLSIGGSPFATYEKSEGEFDYLHLGYETTLFKNIFLLASYQSASIKAHVRENPSYRIYSPFEIENEVDEEIITTEFKYNYETDINRLIVGSKLRFKKFDVISAEINGGIDINNFDYSKQNTYSLFAEDRFSISDNNIVNFAAQYIRVDNNANIDDANLVELRLSHTYLYNDFIFKSFIYRTESLVEPYIYLDLSQPSSLEPQRLHAISEEIKYHYNRNDLRFLFTYSIIKDMFVVDRNLALYRNSEQDLDIFSTYLEHTYNFNINNKLVSNVSYEKAMDYDQKTVAAFIRSLNIVGKFEIFNELIYNYTNTNHENYYDYSAGVKYHYNRAFTLSVKGENIFDKGYEEHYSRINPLTGQSDTPVAISPIEQRVYFTAEYLF